jgi:VWFA-related protein
VLDPLEVTEAAQIASVVLPATVLDERGKFVRDLTVDDFALLEDGTAQELDLASQDREPALFALLVDASQSMSIRAGAVRASAGRLVDALGEQDQVVVAPFSKTIQSVTGPTTDRDTILGAIGAIQHKGGTAILDSLAEASDALRAVERRKAIVLLTDGYDEHSETGIDRAVEALRTGNLTLYVIGMGGIAGISLRGEELLKQLSEDSGGHAWFPRDEAQLRFAYEAIASDVQNQYLLTYTPTNQRQDGEWRSVEVDVPGTTHRVNTRAGYTAPLAPPIRASVEFTGIGAGQAPLVLVKDDLRVVEDGIDQEIDVFNEAVLPVTFMLALDASGSMRRSAEHAQEAAREFIGSMRPEDELGMILFADTADYIQSPGTRVEWSLEAIDNYVAAGGTALYDALYDSLAQLEGVPGRRVVVVVTDGRDENNDATAPGSLRTWEDVLRKLGEVEATVYAVGIGSNVDRNRLQVLADRSGGGAFFPADASALAADYHKILDELRRRYVIAYESSNRVRDGGWRTVEIHHRNAEVEIRSRGGYFAPAQ